MTTLNTIIEEENTPDTEWEKEFDSFFQARIWKTKEGETLGHWNAPDVFTMRKFIERTLSSRDTYWKERVARLQGFIGGLVWEEWKQNSVTHNNQLMLIKKELQALDTLLDNLK